MNKLFLIFIINFAFVSKNVSAQVLGDEKIRVLKNEQKKSSVKFNIINTRNSLYFRSTVIPAGAGEKYELPLCSKNEILREEKFGNDGKLDIFDILYYNPRVAEHLKFKKNYKGFKVPYLPSAEINPYYDYDLYQSFARLVDVKCLPTRFRIITEGGKTFAEKRQGGYAWQE